MYQSRCLYSGVVSPMRCALLFLITRKLSVWVWLSVGPTVGTNMLVQDIAWCMVALMRTGVPVIMFAYTVSFGRALRFRLCGSGGPRSEWWATGALFLEVHSWDTISSYTLDRLGLHPAHPPLLEGHQNRRVRTPGHPKPTVNHVLCQPNVICFNMFSMTAGVSFHVQDVHQPGSPLSLGKLIVSYFFTINTD